MRPTEAVKAIAAPSMRLPAIQWNIAEETRGQGGMKLREITSCRNRVSSTKGPVSAPTFRCLFLQRVLSCAPTFWYSSKRRRVLVRARPHGSVPRRGWPVPSHRKTGALGHWDRVFRLFHPAPTGARAVAAVSVTNRADSRRPRPCGAVLEPERLNRRVDTGYRGEDLFFESGEPARLSLGITRSPKASEPLKLGRLRPQTGRKPTRLSHRHNERSMLRRELGWRIEGIHSLQGFLTSRTPTDGTRVRPIVVGRRRAEGTACKGGDGQADRADAEVAPSRSHQPAAQARSGRQDARMQDLTPTPPTPFSSRPDSSFASRHARISVGVTRRYT